MSESPFTPLLGPAIASTRRSWKEQRGPVVAQCQSPSAHAGGDMSLGGVGWLWDGRGADPPRLHQPPPPASCLALPPPNPASAMLPPLHLSNLLLENAGISQWKREKGAGDAVDRRGRLGLR